MLMDIPANRRNSYWHLSAAVSPRAADKRERRCCQQLWVICRTHECWSTNRHYQMLVATIRLEKRWWTPSWTAFAVLLVGLRMAISQLPYSRPRRQLLVSSRLLDLPLLRRRYWFWLWCTSLGTPLDRIWKEVEARVRRLSGPSRLHRGCGAIQRGIVDPQHH